MRSRRHRARRRSWRVWLFTIAGCLLAAAALAVAVLAPIGLIPGIGPFGDVDRSHPTVTTRPPRQGGTFTMAMVAPESLDPAAAASPTERVLAANLFDGLTRLGHHAGALPAVATDWSSDADQRQWTFALREEATYADGTAVTAEDFVRAWGRAGQSPRASVRALLANLEGATEPGDTIRGVTAADQHTLVVRLVEPDADFPALAADPALAPVPPAAVSRPDAWVKQPVGNGPFTLESVSADAVTLVPNPNYAGDAPYLDTVEIRTVPDELTAWIAFQEGTVQYAPVPLNQLPTARSLYGSAEDPRVDDGVISTPLAAVDVLTFDTATPPMDDQRYRMAVSLAIDRARLAERFAGGRVAADGAVPDGVRSTSGAACQPCGHDPDRARELLAEIGEAAPLTLAVGDSPAEQAIAQQITSDLAAVGIRTSVQPAPASQRTRGAATLSVAAAPAGLGLDAFLTTWYASATPGAPNTDGTAASLLTQAAATPREPARLEVARRAQEQLEADAAVIPLLERRQRAILSPGTQGLDLTPDNLIDFSTISLTD